MAITYSFTDNITYGTDDINDITRNLTGSGVAPFISKSSYALTDLNTLTSALVTSGVQLGGCKCSISNNVITVSQGIIFFENGVALTVDHDGYTVSVTPGTAGKIFAHFDTSTQKADILFAENIPDNGYSVLLFDISAAGSLTDKRSFAKSKIATLGKNVPVIKKPTSIINEPSTLANGTEGYIVIKIDDVDLSKYNYAIFSLPPGLGIETACFCVVDLATGRFIDRAFVWYGAEPQSSKAHFVYDFGNVSTNSYNISLYIRIIGSAFCVICDKALPSDYNLHPTIIFV